MPPTTETKFSLTPETQQFRSRVGQISRQSGIFFAGTIFTALVGYLFKIYLARVLGAEALGIYALGMTVVGLTGIFGGLGLTWAASRFPQLYINSGRLYELRSFLTCSVLILIGANGVIATGIVLARHWIANRVYHTPQLEGFLYLFALILFFGALTTFFGQLLTGYKDVTQRTIITSFVGVSLNVALAVFLVARGAGLWGYIFAQVVSAAVVLILLIRAVYRLTPVPARFSWKAVGLPSAQIFSFATAALAMDVVGFLYSQTDKVILGLYLNARSVGIYAAAAAIVAFVPIALQSVNQIFSPTIADIHARGDVLLLNRLYQTLTKWITALTLPLGTVVIVFSRPLMRVFGPEFEAGWLILAIGTAGQLVNCAVGSVGYLLLMSGNERTLVKVQTAVGVLSVIASLALVPRWGMTGAALAAAAGNAVSNLWCLWEVRRAMGLFPYNRGYWRLIFPTASVLVATSILKVTLRSARPDLVVVMASTLVVYAVFFAALLLAGFDSDDRLIADAIWSRVRNLASNSETGIA